jgi:hypothetical protein
MTGPEMNAFPAKKVASGLALVLTVGAGGCVGSFDPETDAASPVAPRVQALVDANRTYPRWADFPATPTDLPQATEIAGRVNTLRVTSGALQGEVSRIEWTLADPDAFAQSVISRIDAARVSPVTAETQAEIDAFARRLRERGKAPPPVDRH